MRKGQGLLFYILTLFYFIPSLQVQAQNFDCDLAMIICSDSTINFQPNGGGINDFANPNNDSGCFVPEPSEGFPAENYFEQASGWFYFEFRKDMPDSSIIEFAIIPQLTGPDDVSDYDFAVYGPNVRCDSLGSPKRCSFVNGNCAYCPDTGLGRGEIDESEDTWVPDNNANGFVAPMIVQPGEGYFLFLEYFEGDDPVDLTRFFLDWEGNAAPFLNCIANPFCYRATAQAGQDTSICAGSTIQLQGNATNTFGQESYIWSAISGNNAWLTDRFAQSPNLTVPIDFSGLAVFELLVEEGNCEKRDTVVIDVIPYPPLNITGDDFICEGELVTLNATPGFESYLWSTGETTSSIIVNDGGTYELTVTNSMACERVASYTVFMEKFPDPIIKGDPGFCVDGSTILRTDDAYANYNWSTGANGPEIQVDQEGTYSVTVTTALGGCVGTESIDVVEYPEPSVTITGDTDLCPDEVSTLSLTDTYQSYSWSTLETSASISIDQEGVYFVNVVDANGCAASDTITAVGLSPPEPLISGPNIFCPGDTIDLITDQVYASYEWSTGATTQQTAVADSGVVSVIVTDNNGCIGDTVFSVAQYDTPQPQILGADAFCSGDSVLLQTDAAFSAYAWSEGSSQASIVVRQGGSYAITVTDDQGCRGVADINLIENTLPQPIIEGPADICSYEVATLQVTTPFVAYEWQNGSTDPLLEVNQTGSYTITVVDTNGCTGTTVFDLMVNQAPAPEILGERTFCQDDTLRLEADQDYAQYIWSTAETTKNIGVLIPGEYQLIVTDDKGCSGDTTVNIIQFSKPEPFIEGANEFCSGQSVALSLNRPFSAYLWENGATTPGITVNQGGRYSVTVTDLVGCSADTSFFVTENALPTPDIQGPSEICSYEMATLSVPTGFQSYQWQDGSIGTTLVVDQTGVYSVEVSDDKGCIGTDTLVFQVNQAPLPSIDGEELICRGDTVTLNAEAPEYTGYAWSTGDSGSAIFVTTAGNYELTVTDVNGCIGSNSFSTSIKELPIPVVDGNPEFCEGQTTTLRSREAFTSYQWSNGENTPEITISTPGEYILTVVDDDGCRGQQNIVITENPNPRPNIMGEQVFCSNESTNLGVDNEYAVYRWSTGEQSINIFVTKAGTYQITVIDDKGCSGTDSIVLTTLPAPQPDIAGDNMFCEGDTLTFGASQEFQAYEWSTGETTRNISVAIPDNYRLTVTDVNGCMGEASFQPIQFSRPRPVIEGQDSFCEGEITSLSTERNYESYEWSDGSNGRQIEVSVPGTYTVTVTDRVGCVGSTEQFVRELQNPVPQITGDTLLCIGDNSTLDAGGEFVGYIWESGEREQTISVNQSGRYQVTVIDSQGCSGVDAVEVAVFDLPDPVISGAATFCPGDTILLEVADFNTYQWSNGAQTRQIDVSAPGVYQITVTNAAQCAAETSVTIDVFQRPPLSVDGNRFFCEGTFTNINATPGYPRYQWSNGATTAQLTVTVPGTYTLEVTDDNGCRNQEMVSVEEIPTPAPVIQGPNTLCDNETASLAVSDDFAAFEWSTGAQGRAIQIDQAGLYELTVTDEFGCSGQSAINVTLLEAPDPVLEGEEDFCPGDSVLLSIADIYQSYNWNDGFDQATRFVKEGGQYVVQVTADNGCRATVSKRVFARPDPDFAIQGDSSYCEGESTILSVPSGFRDYLWSTGDTSANIVINSPGSYQVQLSNEFACTSTRSVIVEELPTLDPILPEESSLCSGDSLVLNAGNNYRDYLWDNGSTDPFRLITSAGTYMVTVTNFNGCVQALESEVAEITPVLPEIAGANAVCEGQGLGLFVRGSFENYRWSTGDTTPAITVRNAGNYKVTVTDRNGCVNSQVKPVSLLSSPKVTLSGLPYFCEGDSTVLTAEIDGGTFEWSDGRTTPSVTVTEPGNYGVFVRSTNGCNVVSQVRVEEFQNPEPSISGLSEICSDQTAQLDAGEGYVRYNWSTGSDQQQITVAQTGRYEVMVVDSSGCSGRAAVNLTVNQIPEPLIVGKMSICPGETIVLRLDQEFAAYTWSNGLADSAIEVSNAGSYSVAVLDEKGCRGQGNFNLKNGEVPVIRLQGDSVMCEGGQVQIGVVDTFVTYRWSDGRGGRSVDFFEPGLYEVSVRNTDGCQQSKSFTIREVPRPIANAGADITADCTEPAIALDGSGSSSGSQYLYRWTGPDINRDNQNLIRPLVNASGRYRLIVEDTINGCISPVDEVEINFLNIAPNATVFTDGVLTCDNDKVLLGADPVNDNAQLTFRWFDPQGQPLSPDSADHYFAEQAGVFEVLITDQQTGCSNVKTVEVTENLLPPTVEAGPDLYLNCNETTVKLNGADSDQGSSYAIQWTSREAYPIIDANTLQPKVSRPGVYHLTIRRLANGCFGTDSVRVLTDTLLPVAEAGPDRLLSCNDPFVRLDGAGSSGAGDLNYRWTSPDHPDFIAISARPSVTRPGTYFLKVEDEQNGCISLDSVVVEAGSLGPEDLFFSVRPPSCLGDKNGQIVLDSVKGGVGPFLYSFELQPFSFETSWDGIGAGTYRIIVQDVEGCEYLKRVEVADGGTISVRLGPDQEIRKGEFAEINPFIPALPASDLDSILWSPLDSLNCQDPECLNVTANPTFDQTYTLRVVDQNGCIAEDQINILVNDTVDTYIPNAFSPNEDGINDRFTVYGSDFVKQVKVLQVFDRWGNQVFQRNAFPPNDENMGWDGFFRGRRMNPAVFVYYAEVEMKDGEIEYLKGDVVLMK